MAQAKFTHQQIERYNDRIKNCLDDPNCRPVLGRFLSFLRKPMLVSTLKLWEAANSTNSWEEGKMLDLIDDVDDFNQSPLLSIAECQHKIDYTKGECCRILEKALPAFITYLHKHHKSGPC